jgi:hypothetical protein
VLHAAAITLGMLSWAQAAHSRVPPPAPPVPSEEVIIAKARTELRAVPSCKSLKELREELARVGEPANRPLTVATLKSLREEVRVRLPLLCKKAASPPSDGTNRSVPPGPERPKAVSPRPPVTPSPPTEDPMVLIDGLEQVLSDGTKTCHESGCRQALDAFSEDLLRLMLTVYAQAKPTDAIVPKLREKLGALLVKNIASQPLLERLKEMLATGGVTPDQFSQSLEGKEAIQIMLTIYKQQGSQALIELLKDPASAGAIATLLRQGGLDADRLQVIVEAGVGHLFSGGAAASAQKEGVRRGIELAAALADPQAERNLIAASRALQARSPELGKLVVGLENKQLDAAAARAIAQQVDKAIWDELIENKASMEHWTMPDPRNRVRRILPVILEPPPDAGAAPPGKSPTCDPLRRFAESYFRFFYSTRRLMPRPALPIDPAQLPVDEKTTAPEAVLVVAKRLISNPADQACGSPKDELDRALCPAPIGVIVVARGEKSSADDGSARASISWLIQTGGGAADWNRQVHVPSNVLPASCETTDDQDRIDAEAVRVAVSTSRGMTLLSERMESAFHAPVSPSPFGALLFAGMPYLNDPQTPAWSRWVTSGADVVGSLASVGALLWSAKLRNDFSEGRTSSLDGANNARFFGVGAAVSVLAVRLASLAYYHVRFERQ